MLIKILNHNRSYTTVCLILDLSAVLNLTYTTSKRSSIQGDCRQKTKSVRFAAVHILEHFPMHRPELDLISGTQNCSFEMHGWDLKKSSPLPDPDPH